MSEAELELPEANTMFVHYLERFPAGQSMECALSIERNNTFDVTRRDDG